MILILGEYGYVNIYDLETLKIKERCHTFFGYTSGYRYIEFIPKKNQIFIATNSLHVGTYFLSTKKDSKI